MLAGMMAGVLGKGRISVDTNWGASSANNSVITSATSTMSAPPGSNLLLDITATVGAVTAQYQKNGGAFTTFTDLTVLAIAQGDTLAFRVTGAPTIGDGYNLSVKDNATGLAIANTGTASFSRS